MSVAASPKHGTERRRPSTVLHAAYSPPKQPTLRGMGGEDRECLPWRRPRTAQHVAYPPLEKPQKNMTGGGEPGACHSPL